MTCSVLTHINTLSLFPSESRKPWEPMQGFQRDARVVEWNTWEHRCSCCTQLCLGGWRWFQHRTRWVREGSRRRTAWEGGMISPDRCQQQPLPFPSPATGGWGCRALCGGAEPCGGRAAACHCSLGCPGPIPPLRGLLPLSLRWGCLAALPKGSCLEEG